MAGDSGWIKKMIRVLSLTAPAGEMVANDNCAHTIPALAIGKVLNGIDGGGGVDHGSGKIMTGLATVKYQIPDLSAPNVFLAAVVRCQTRVEPAERVQDE